MVSNRKTITSGSAAAQVPESASNNAVALISWLILGCVTITTFLVFFPALQNGFVGWDDPQNLLDNFSYRGLSWSNLRWMFTTFHMSLYRPLTWMTWASVYQVSGSEAWSYHLISVVLHCANVGFFYLLSLKLLRLVRPTNEVPGLSIRFAAGFAALLFSIHPLRVEAVAWISALNDVLSGLFFLGAIICHLNYVTLPQDSKTRKIWFAAGVVVYGMSLLAKGGSIGLPFVLLILDYYPLMRLSGRRPGSRFVKDLWWVCYEKLPYFALSIAAAYLNITAKYYSGVMESLASLGFAARLAQSLYGVAFYLWKTLLPLRLSPLYERPYNFDPWTALFLACAAAVVAISFTLFLLRRRWPGLLACWCYYLAMVAPLLGVAQSGPQLVADRYSYLSCLSWALLAGGVFHQCLKSTAERADRPVLFVASSAMGSVALLILGFLTWRQTEVWRDSKTLWAYAIQVGTDSAVARYNLARIFEQEGKLRESKEYYRRATAINPTYADAHYNLARLLAKSGEQTEAIYHYRQALQSNPNDAETLNNLGLLLAVRGEIDEALKYLRRDVQANPNYPQAFYNIGRILTGQGNYAEAIRSYQEALKLSPNQAEIHFELGKALAGQGRTEKAAQYFRSAIELKPNLPDAHVGLARLLATQGKTDEAAQHYQEAQRILRAQSERSERR